MIQTCCWCPIDGFDETRSFEFPLPQALTTQALTLSVYSGRGEAGQPFPYLPYPSLPLPSSLSVFSYLGRKLEGTIEGKDQRAVVPRDSTQPL